MNDEKSDAAKLMSFEFFLWTNISLRQNDIEITKKTREIE